MTEKRFTIIYNEHSKMMQYVDNQKKEPNRWATWNVSETAQKLNKLNNENKQLKKQRYDLYMDIARLVKENGQLIDEAEEYRKLSLKFDNRNKDLIAENALLEKENQELKQVSQDYEDNVSDWFIENWHTLSDEQKQSAHLELGIDIEYDGDMG